MTQNGKLVEWNDVRGFGFIEATDGERYFVHISDITRIATRPRAGDRMSFTASQGRDGRKQAKRVTIQGANPRPDRETLERGLPQQRRGRDWRFVAAGTLAALLAAALASERLPWQIVALYIVVGAISVVSYALDKRFAETGSWRISEAQLLGTDLLFGIIGGLFGQAVFRHKTRKQGYVGSTIAITALHLLGLAAVTSDVLGIEELLAILPI